MKLNEVDTTQRNFELLEIGWHEVKIVNASRKFAKAISVEAEVIGKDRKIFFPVWLTKFMSKDGSVQIGATYNFLKALNCPDDLDLGDDEKEIFVDEMLWIDKMLQIEVTGHEEYTNKDGKKRTKEIVGDYKKIEGGEDVPF